MPGWNIHLEIGRRVAKRMKLTGRSREEFLLGCLLPDINNGYINNVKVRKEHGETHWAFDEKSSLNFYGKYQKEIDERNPIYLGYLLHLYTDGYFNYHFYHHVKRTQIGASLTHEEKQKIKHNDFWIYDMKFRGQKFKISNKKDIVEKVNKIENMNLNVDEIGEVEEIMKSDDFAKKIEGKKYIFYTERWLDELLDEMIESFVSKYLRELADA